MSARAAPLFELLAGLGEGRGLPSICSAHPLVIEATLRGAADHRGPVLIEATCNQVNHEGGYTGMTPAAFRTFVADVAADVGFDLTRLVLGGDHLGPSPWKHLPPDEAMARADAMVDAFVRAGFTKIHLDASMACRGDPAVLPVEVAAARAARLAAIAEAAAPAPLAYVIGTEVPVPGGAAEMLHELAVTRPEAARRTVEAHASAFAARGLQGAFDRVIGLVVQPGVEFGADNVIVYDPSKAVALRAALQGLPHVVYEAHSTDYQPAAALAALVADGCAILKVGPALTFALREALYALDHVASLVDDVPPHETLSATMERIMRGDDRHWAPYHHGSEVAQRLGRHFSYSDRIRYYWSHPDAELAVRRLVDRLSSAWIPATLVSQYFGALYPRVAAGELAAEPKALMLASVQRVLSDYDRACRPEARG